ncbi:extracellular solute-binding protein [Sneathiella marina]|uniref:Extracellular solute-binding protein n=1 Tax=Sneathiella marina TaxID=2950108 RepID=A0ABY4W648_9PROT|nr:extracellular solute-binding protein [Sneathiella marina]USG61598.1 extracellular solute-binding protein [Sneathiella marina]
MTAAPSIKKSKPTLRVLGTAVTLIEPIRKEAEKDLGINLEFTILDGTEAQRKGAMHPESFDVYDQWFHDLDLIWPANSIGPIDVSRIHNWEQINLLPKAGKLVGSSHTGLHGDPSKRLYVQLDGTLGQSPSGQISMLPTVHNADSFVVPEELADKITSWACLLDPKWSGRVVLQRDAAIGCLDILLALSAKKEFQAADIGNLELEEIDELAKVLRRYRTKGHFRSIWADEIDAIAAIDGNTPIIGSMWWSGLIALRAKGIPVTMATPTEGYRGWFGGIALSRRLDDRTKDAAYEYLNWWLEGHAGALATRNGAYMSNPQASRRYLSKAEWDFWYGGKPAREIIRNTFGAPVFKKGDVRPGGAYEERMSKVVVWDTIMDEHNYLVRHWDYALGL